MSTVETEALPKCIQQALDNLDTSRNRLYGLTNAARVAESVLRQHRVSDTDHVELCWNVTIYLYVSHWRQVTPILRGLAAGGFHQQQGQPPSDNFISHSRQWRCGDIEICAFIPSSNSGQCRRVQVGEETKTVPVYKWECDNGEEE